MALTTYDPGPGATGAPLTELVLTTVSIVFRFFRDVVLRILFLVIGRRYVLFVRRDIRVVLFEPDLRLLANRDLLIRERRILAGKPWG